jgi:hypothetical protein
MSDRRLVLERPDGLTAIRDLERPESPLVAIPLPDGRRVMVAAHLCGWATTDPPETAAPLWDLPADAVRALEGTTSDGTDWTALLEEFARRSP